MNLLAVTACPTGIAHSQMAAENLENTAEELGHDIQVEVEGAMGTENELSSEQIAAADAVIVAADTTIHTDRFEGVPVIKGSVKDAVNDPEDLIRRAVDEAGGDAAGDDAAGAGTAADADVAEATGDPADAASGTDAEAAQGGREPASEPPASPDAGSSDDAETATANDGHSERASRQEHKGIVGKIKSLFS